MARETGALAAGNNNTREAGAAPPDACTAPNADAARRAVGAAEAKFDRCALSRRAAHKAFA